MNNTLSKLKINNEYYTPKWVWDCLKPYIPTNKTIWEAFCCDDPESRRSAEYLKELGFDVICNGEDFFDSDFGDIVCSNPPFSKRVDFIKSDKSKSKATFHTLVICYKINLSERIIFI